MGTDDFLRGLHPFCFACILVRSLAFSRCAPGHLTVTAIQSSLVPEGSCTHPLRTVGQLLTQYFPFYCATSVPSDPSPPQLQQSRNVHHLLIAPAALT
ncbi:hypothetical protein FB451DRAFT_1258140 [Mycena latifolia]|nr:hypothetical protein FB451DRAFT_1258140 [Mycena latifolia]